MALNRELLEILACPTCRGELTLTAGEDGLCCPKCGVVYPIREEIPIMLTSEAISQTDWDGGVRQAGGKRSGNHC